MDKHIVVTVAAFFIVTLMIGVEVKTEKGKRGPRHHSENPIYDQEKIAEAFKSPKPDIEKSNQIEKRTQRRLMLKIAKTHDIDEDKYLDIDEIEDWVREGYSIWDDHRVHEYIRKYDTDENGDISFEEILSYAFNEEDLAELKRVNKSKASTEKENKLIERLEDTQKRFDTANKNKDKVLNFEEMRILTQPGYDQEMVLVEMRIAMQRGDLNGDGVISMDEFVDENAPEEAQKHARGKYHEYDLDKDGILSKAELKFHVIEDSEDSARREAHVLLNAADIDKDDKLTLAEISKNSNEFLFHPITDYARTLFLLTHDWTFKYPAEQKDEL